MIAWDVESHLIKPGLAAPKLVCLSAFDGSRRFLVKRNKALGLFRELLKDGIVAHHAPFDLGVMIADFPEVLDEVIEALEAGRVLCTEITERHLRIAKGELKYRVNEDGEPEPTRYSLADLVLMRFGTHLEKKETWRLRYALLDSVPLGRWPEAAKEYALEDSVWAWKVHEDQKKETTPLPCLLDDVRAAMVLQGASSWGPRTDPKAVAALEEALGLQVSKANDHLLKAGILKIGGPKKAPKLTKDTKRIAALLEEAGTQERTPTGRIKSGKEQLLASGHEDLIVLGESMGARKILETYVPVLKSGTEKPICASYVVPLETGRTSCRKPNLQNPPRKNGVRECFVSRPGTVFVSADLEAAELRAWAQACLWKVGFSDLGKAFKEGKDPHLLLAATLLGISDDEAKKRFEEGDPIVIEARQFSKIPNFTFIGGGGPGSFEKSAAKDKVLYQGKPIDLNVAKMIRGAWLRRWREAKPYLNLISREQEAGLPVVHEGTGFIRGCEKYTERANTRFQHLIAVVAKKALWRVWREQFEESSPLFDSRITLFLHDEIVLESPEEKASGAAKRLVEIMCAAGNEVLPDVGMSSSPAMSRRWYKGTKPVYLNGELVPSKPEGKKWIADLGTANEESVSS